jgi:hypothetical protein
MSLTRFASICDVPGCGKRSAEYTAWPHCIACGRDLCPVHRSVGSYDEETGTALCLDCAKVLAVKEHV